MTSNTQNNYQPWVSYAKGIAIVLIVYRHVLNGVKNTGLDVPEIMMQANEVIYSFRLPLFYILSGFFLRRSIFKRSNSVFVNYKLKTLIYPYLVWAVLQVSIQFLLSGYTNATRGWWDYAYIIIQPRAIDQLWFIYALFNVSMIFFIAHRFLKMTQIQMIVLGIFLHYMSTFVQEYSLFRDMFYFFIFLVIGDVSYNFITDPKRVALFSSYKFILALTPVFILTQWAWLVLGDNINLFLFAMIALLGSFYTMVLCLKISETNSMKYLKLFGEHSLYIFLAHVLCSAPIRIVMVNFLGITNVYIVFIAALIGGIILPIVLYRLSKRFGFSFIFKMPELATKKQ